MKILNPAGSTQSDTKEIKSIIYSINNSLKNPVLSHKLLSILKKYCVALVIFIVLYVAGFVVAVSAFSLAVLIVMKAEYRTNTNIS